ncbi:MAG TPA: hypothetical protein EYN07_03595 [Flavobacteriaceae bacterium]|jgi:hypothetical protein|nr:hypothetical protein [Flavobacteriaceae bacterium]MAM30154.1 hypothetical protein [Flavobacteriaceae bacterium]MAY53259.1 hypothetical protein [Flavobacteriaceae bacterium]HBR54144.1 hypothetical protein [Flavobacteriaceae bacterium]HIB49272.1 hypothetical protein [Flavobacteriaceae bacterium]|tara:strand:- start:153 stop:500 length:348 start_codon:yes stop_codon:yes gene_type:complete
MKKFITGIAFAVIVLFGMNTATAQSLSKDDSRPEAIAKTTVAKLAKDLDLSGDQERAMFRAYVQKEVSYKKSVNGLDQKDAAVMAAKKKVDAQLEQSVKKTLTPAQFKKWQSMQK